MLRHSTRGDPKTMSQPDFDWMSVPHKPNPGAFDAQYVAEIKARARLLFNLGFGPTHATASIERALAWEFDGRVWPKKAKPAFLGQVRTLVEEVYRRLTPAG